MTVRAGVLLLLTVAAHGDDWDLLRRAAAAEAGRARVGVQMVSAYPTDQPVTGEVVVADDGAGHARREHRAGPSRGLIVIIDGAWEWRRSPGATVWQRQAVHPDGDLAIAADAVGRAAANYRLARSSGGPVAGRATTRLDLTPKEPGNPSRRLWLDATTGLALKSEVRNHAGQLAQAWAYTSIRYEAPAAATVRLPADARRETRPTAGGLEPMSLADVERSVGAAILKPTWLPAGYRARTYYRRACREGGWSPVSTFSDGLNTLTLTETRGRGSGRGRRWRGGRCTVQSGRLQVVVRLSVGGHEAVVVGDHAREGLEALARSLQ